MATSPHSAAETPDHAARKRVVDLLARALPAELQDAWDQLAQKPDYKPVRGPETGLVMIRGRTGGGGAPFNLGEATVTRASVALSTGEVGHAYALGTDRKRARLAAVFDAMAQRADGAAFVEQALLAPVSARLSAEDRATAEKTAATRVDFFTMVRGED